MTVHHIFLDLVSDFNKGECGLGDVVPFCGECP